MTFVGHRDPTLHETFPCHRSDNATDKARSRSRVRSSECNSEQRAYGERSRRSSGTETRRYTRPFVAAGVVIIIKRHLLSTPFLVCSVWANF